jgi:parallel beta-helix repeat protein
VRDSPYGALGDGVADDTAAIQLAVDAVAGTGGTVRIPAGTYMVDAETKIRLGSDMTIRLEANATLKAIPNSATGYAILLASGVSNVNVIGGTLEGERGSHTVIDPNNPGEAGTGLQIVGSTNIVVDGVQAKESWGDGFYVGETSENITLCGVVSDHNRRQGMSITSVDGMVVRDSTFRNTTIYVDEGATWCGAGIDIEPNQGETVNDVRFTGCTFATNAGAGLATGPSLANTGNAFVTNVVIDGNTASGNGADPQCAGDGFDLSNSTGYQVLNNVVADNVGIGIYLRPGANDSIVTGNTVTGTVLNAAADMYGYGIMLYETQGNTVTGNTVTDNAGCGIRDAYPTGSNTISPNSESGNGACP